MTPEPPSLRDLFPESGALLLTGSGRAFVERLGLDAVREVVLGVLNGENVRTQTEPLTRRRITLMSAAVVAMFAKGWEGVPGFTERLSALAAADVVEAKRSDKRGWPAQWALGLTNKAVQNVLRGRDNDLAAYVAEFDAALADAAARSQADYGEIDVRIRLDGSTDVQVGWDGLSRLMTAIGSITLALRGSDKSTYGKLFERLVLGTALTLLGFEHVQPDTNRRTDRVFWLSDSRSAREADATAILAPGRIARFDIGFIGPGNSEISKDKLSRFERDIEIDGVSHGSHTFVVVDRLPAAGRTHHQATRIGATIVQMSLTFWMRDLAGHLFEVFGYDHPVRTMSDDALRSYLSTEVARVAIQDFVGGVASA